MKVKELQEQIGAERLAAFQQAFSLNRRMSTRSRARLLEMVRNGYQGLDPSVRALDQLLLGQWADLGNSIEELRRDLKQTAEKLTAPPHIPAVYLGAIENRAWVSIEGRGQRVVEPNNVDLSELHPGDGVYLSHECNVLLGHMPATTNGFIGRFERTARGGQAVISHRGEEVLCTAVNGLKTEHLSPGDAILIDPPNRLAIEKIEERAERLPFEMEEIPELTRKDLGGLDEQTDTVLGTLAVNLDTDLTKRFGIDDDGAGGMLLQGPPGNGKTRIVKVAASELMKRSGCKMRFISIRPAEWKDKFVGATEEKIRNTFRAIRQVSNHGTTREHVIVFLDELESFGRSRGTSGTHSFVDDFTNTLLAELEGFEDLLNVSIIGATNRKDLIDQALLERIARITVTVPRPNLPVAREILGIHLPERIPWESPDARLEAIEAAAAFIYLGEQNGIAKITFNDSSTRTVEARELVSGRFLASIAGNTKRIAARRCSAAATPDGVVEIGDLLGATEDAIAGLRTALSRENVHSYLPDVKQDLTVVAVEPVHPKPRRIQPYLNS